MIKKVGIYTIILLKSKRFWVSVATIAAGSSGLIPPPIALKVGAVGTIITKIIDTVNSK